MNTTITSTRNARHETPAGYLSFGTVLVNAGLVPPSKAGGFPGWTCDGGRHAVDAARHLPCPPQPVTAGTFADRNIAALLTAVLAEDSVVLARVSRTGAIHEELRFPCGNYDGDHFSPAMAAALTAVIKAWSR